MSTFYNDCFNPFPNKPWFLHVYSKSLFKKLWEKEKLLVTSNFSFSHSVFLQVLRTLPFQPIPTQWRHLTPLGNKPFENTVGKGEIARYEQFLLFPQCFLPIWITFCHFRQIWNCRLQTLSLWKSLKFVVW